MEERGADAADEEDEAGGAADDRQNPNVRRHEKHDLGDETLPRGEKTLLHFRNVNLEFLED